MSGTRSKSLREGVFCYRFRDRRARPVRRSRVSADGLPFRPVLEIGGGHFTEQPERRGSSRCTCQRYRRTSNLDCLRVYSQSPSPPVCGYSSCCMRKASVASQSCGFAWIHNCPPESGCRQNQTSPFLPVQLRSDCRPSLFSKILCYPLSLSH